MLSLSEHGGAASVLDPSTELRVTAPLFLHYSFVMSNDGLLLLSRGTLLL
ncbi:MAG: hypothetical protein JWR38_1501 [Mucilaginibacter sp.]|nr:hypothetical protein [Mucilaginibacter sp.]